MSSFLPTNYQKPQLASSAGGDYVKFAEGETRLRILTKTATTGCVYWNTDGKPVRSAEAPEGQPADIRIGKDGKPEKVKAFWAVVAYNYNTKQVELWEITQVGIMDALIKIASDEDYGHPNNYDVKVSKTVTGSGANQKTSYTVTAGVPKAIPQEAIGAARAKPINPKALLTGDNPFAAATPPPAAAPVVQKPAPVAAGEVDDNDLPF